jgi:hypothetical protein
MSVQRQSPRFFASLPGARTALRACMLFLACALPLGAFSQDEPSEAPAPAEAAPAPDAGGAAAEVLVDPSLWVLDFEVKKVSTVSIVEGPFKGEVHWFMVYSVENKSDEERPTYLAITAASDRKKIYTDRQLTEVERAIERKIGRPLWGRTDLFEEQKDRDPKDTRYQYTTFKAREKRECVAVFGKVDPGANKIEIQVRGLSNDHHLIQKDDGSRFVEERVYEIRYERPEDVYGINLDRFTMKGKGWLKKQVEMVISEAKE